MEVRNVKRRDHAVELKSYVRDQIVTIGDLEEFRNHLLNDLKKLLTQQQVSPEKKWLKSWEVRKLLKISAGTLQNLRDNGTLRFTKLGGIIFFRYADIQLLMDSQEM